MTGASPVPDRPALRAALCDMRIEPADSGARFESALAALHGWTVDFAERVTDEYRRFLYLAAIAGFEVTPSRYVDEAWHLHLLLPHYREVLCNRILGRPLGHLPGTGTPEDDARCARQYEETLALYERVFGAPPPADIWPRSAAREEAAAAPGRLRLNPCLRIAAACAVPGLLLQMAGASTPALGFFGVSALFLVIGLAQKFLAHPTGSGGDAGGGLFCGASDGGDGGGSDGSASCGGGCGGCGGD